MLEKIQDVTYKLQWTAEMLILSTFNKKQKGYKKVLSYKEVLRMGGWL
ncbi:hypothetical protein MWG07_10015 [Fusobacterium necrophorum]|uniref:Uncharacterized protein n=1 Tax=Fusobacterium necrophorum TaxID=859 RepID=A0AAW6WD58_9FUSO|nr:hypothetical protein [Fusobacterium necrophorum]MDK4481526.1 hypothetical protein [Fusobacterium necrophorum]MDK4512585.1 hypothetical protein [Fusobacterium necrophorum]